MVIIAPVEKITRFGEEWYTQEFCGNDGNLKAVRLYNCFGEFETEQPDRDALEDWFLDNVVSGE